MKIIVTFLIFFLSINCNAQSVKETIQYINDKIDLYNHTGQRWEEPVNGIVKIIATKTTDNYHWKIDLKDVKFEKEESVSDWTGEILWTIYIKGDIKFYEDNTRQSFPFLTFYLDTKTERDRLLKAFKHLQSTTKGKDLFD